MDADSAGDTLSWLEPDQFGYRSTHYSVRLLPDRAHLPEWRDFAQLRAEIQIRTVLQHAWAAISHALQYKREFEVPSQFRRRLSRLAGMLELADEEFTGVRRDQIVARQAAEMATNEQNVLALELNKETLPAFISSSEHLARVVCEQLGQYHARYSNKS